MNLAQALKKKNRLISELKEIISEIPNYICEINPNEFRKDYNQMIDSYESKTKELIDLKVAINKANIGISSKIYALSELKTKLNLLHSIKRNIRTGEVKDYNGTISIYKSQITLNDIDSKIKEVKSLIEKTQDDIDEYNASTKID